MNPFTRAKKSLQPQQTPRNAAKETQTTEPAEATHEGLPERILQLQRVIGNAAVVQLLRRSPEASVKLGVLQRDDPQVSEPLSENATQDLDPAWLAALSLEDLMALKQVVEADVLISQKDEAVEEAAFVTSRSNLEAIRLVLESKLAERFSKLPAGIALPTEPKDRIEFLDVMAAYLGSHEAVLTHYENIQPANVPGKPMLHINARTQLEAVSTELGGKIPSTTVAANTRGRYHANNKEPMGHVLGFAIDYRAVENPRIGDSDTLTLLRMDTGGKVNVDMDMTRNQRRALIGEMQAGTADPEKEQAFFTKFESEYKRVAEASQKFGDTLGADATTDMKTLRDRYFKNLTDKLALQKRLKTLEKEMKSKKNQAADKQSTLIEEQTKIGEDVAKIDEDQAAVLEEANVTLQPWKEKITERKEAIETKNPDVFDGKPVDEKSLSKKERERRKYAQDEWKVYDSLEKRLTGDLAFLFGSLESGKPKKNVASQPSVTQLLDKGFFNPDAEAEGKFDPNKNGFNLEFMEAMAKHGFDQGVCWDGAAQDSMHFEYVPDYDKVIDKKETKSKLAELKAIYYGQKKKAKKKKKAK